MTQVTIRRVEEEWVKKEKEEAARRDVSMNQVLLEALSRGLLVSRDDHFRLLPLVELVEEWPSPTLPDLLPDISGSHHGPQ